MWLAPEIASACSCAPWVTIAWPQEETSVPAGSYLLLDLFCGVEALLVSDVRVDGEPVVLVDGPAYGLLTVEPTPVVGQEVQARFCTEKIEDEDLCDEVSFLIEEPVPVTLEPPVLTLEQQWQPSVCAWDWEWGVRVVLEGSDANAGRPVLYELEFDGQGGFERAKAPDGSHTVDLDLRPQHLPEPGQELCVTVRAYDVWGAAAESTTACLQMEPAPGPQCPNPQDNPESCPVEPPPDDDAGSSTTADSPSPDDDPDSSTTQESQTSGAEPAADGELPPRGCRVAQSSHSWWLLLFVGLRRRRKTPLSQ